MNPILKSVIEELDNRETSDRALITIGAMLMLADIEEPTQQIKYFKQLMKLRSKITEDYINFLMDRAMKNKLNTM
jgi:hypothetical protein